jgi:putative Mn2+ efflux pump MntP
VVAKLIALVFPLGLDTFAVAAALGTIGVSPARRLRISLLFTAFEAGMPLIGLAVGAPLGHAIGATADYIAIGVLLAFGLYTLLGSEHGQARLGRLTQMHAAGALLLGISISLDELAIGFTLGLLRLPAGLVIVLIALQAFILTQLGLRLGNRLSERVREGARETALLIVLFITIQVGAAASLARAHQAASELEEGPLLQMPETAAVVVHTEP